MYKDLKSSETKGSFYNIAGGYECSNFEKVEGIDMR